jgi:hypothetical protein
MTAFPRGLGVTPRGRRRRVIGVEGELPSPPLFFGMERPSILAIRQASPKPGDARLHRLARNEAKAFARLVGRGAMTVGEALNTLGILSHDRTCLEDFAAQYGGATARDIRKVIRLRDLAVAEFETLVSSSLCRP